MNSVTSEREVRVVDIFLKLDELTDILSSINSITGIDSFDNKVSSKLKLVTGLVWENEVIVLIIYSGATLRGILSKSWFIRVNSKNPTVSAKNNGTEQ